MEDNNSNNNECQEKQKTDRTDLLEEMDAADVTALLPKGHLSVSQVDMYRRCPRQYYFRHVKGLKIPPSANQAEGSALHHSIALAHVEQAKTGNVPLDLLLDAYNDFWKEIRRQIIWQIDDENTDAIEHRDHGLIDRYRDAFLPKLQARVDDEGPFVEREFWLTVGKARIPFKGYIDLVAKNDTVFSDKKSPDGSGKEEVIDHKVVSKAKTQKDADDDLQLTVYSKQAAVPRVRFQCFFKTKNPQIKAVASYRSNRSWEWAEFVITQVAEAIALGSFPPGPDGWACSARYCGYYDICRGSE